MENYSEIKKLGNGVMGVTYKIKANNKFYALKRQKILKSEINKSSKSKIWREIKFANKMNKYPNHFMKLYKYEIIENCNHIQPISSKIFKPDTKFQKILNSYSDSDYCIELIYDLKDGTLEQIINKLDQNQIYSFIIQLTYAIYLMRSKGYFHTDIHTRNVAYIKCNLKTYIEIFGYKVPTYGYIWSLIDYGEVLSEKFELKKSEKKYFSNPDFYLLDLFGILWMLYIGSNRAFAYLHKLNKLTPYKDYLKSIKERPEYLFTKNMLKNNATMFQISSLFSILYPLENLKLMGMDLDLDANFNTPNGIKKYLETKINQSDSLFFISNIDKPKILIKYFYEKLK